MAFRMSAGFPGARTGSLATGAPETGISPSWGAVLPPQPSARGGQVPYHDASCGAGHVPQKRAAADTTRKPARLSCDPVPFAGKCYRPGEAPPRRAGHSKMPDVSSPTLSFLWIFFSTFGAISVFGFLVDSKISEEYRSKTRDLLNQISPKTWPTSFLALYDAIFRSSGNGRPRVVRSVSASLLTVTIIAVAWGVRQPTAVGSLVEAARGETLRVFTILAFALACNLVVDYLSFWETRLVISRIAKTQRSAWRAALVLFDLLATVAIFLVGLFLALAAGLAALHNPEDSDQFQNIASPLLYEIGHSYSMLIEGGGIMFAGNEDTRVFGVLFFSTLFTSVWVWAYLIGIFLWPMLTFLKRLFNVEKYPVGAAMTIGGVFVALVTASLTLFSAVGPVNSPT